MTAIFVTATGTDVGKTFVTAGLIGTLRAQGRPVQALKPVISGFDPAAVAASDTGAILQAMGETASPEAIQRISPWRFAAPLSPDMAARREGRTVDFDALLAFSRDAVAAASGTALIEGVGGIMVPLDGRHTVLDWMAALRLPVLLVAGSYLGTISHTLSALDVLRRRSLDVMAVVISESPGGTVDLDETAETVRRFGGAVDVMALPRPAPPDHSLFTTLASRL